MPVFLVYPLPDSGSRRRFFFGKDTLWGMFGALIPFLASPRGEKPSSEAVWYGGRGACYGSLSKEEAWGPRPALLPREAGASGPSIPVRTRPSPQSACPRVARLSLPQLGA